MAFWSALRGRFARWRELLSTPAVALSALLAVVYAPLLAGKVIYNRDVLRFLYPIRWFVRDSLERGDPPWWTPHVGLGHSMLADPQAALFYPVNLLHLIGPLPLMVMLVAWLHLLWGAAGMACVARAFRLGRSAALVAGLAWALSGYVTSLLTNGARLPAAAWIPWQVFFSVRVAHAARVQTGRLRAVAWLGLAGAMGLLAGDLFVAAMGQLLGLALGAAALLADGRSARRERPLVYPAARFAWLSALALGLSALSSAVAVVPAARALAGTERSGGLAAATAAAGSLHPLRLAELASPEAFARAWYVNPRAAWVAAYLDGAPLSLSVYVGGSVLVLLALAFAPMRRRPAAEPAAASDGAVGGEPSRLGAVAIAIVGLGFLLVALGQHTPLFAMLRAALPPLAYMRAPEKWLLAVVPCLALLAGLGAQRLTSAAPRPSWTWGLCVPGLILLLALLAPVMFPPDLAAFVRRGAWHGLFAALLVGVAWPLARRGPGLAGAYLLLLVTLDLALATTLSVRFAGDEALRRPALAAQIQPSAHPRLPFPRLYRGSKVLLSASAGAGLDSDDATLETMRDNLSVPLGIAILPGYGVAIPPALPALLAQGRVDALRVLGTEYLLLSSPKGDAKLPDGLTLVSTALPGVRLYRVERVLPRVFVTFAARRRPTAELAGHILDPEVVAGKAVLLDERQRWNGVEADGAAPLPCHLDEFTNLKVRATCDTPAAGLAVVVEQHAAGWSATVDGAPAPLLLANAVLRAVPVPAGKHVVAMVFAPPGLRTGILLSLLGLLATVVLLLAPRLRSRAG
jgi:hypothetical protein